MDRVSKKTWKDWEVRDVKKREKLIKRIGEQIVIIYIWKIAFSTRRKVPAKETFRKRFKRTKTWTVISASFFNIFRAVFNIYTRKKCSEYLLDRLQNTRSLLISFVEWTTWKRPDHPKEKHWPKKVLCALGARITRHYSLHLHFFALLSFDMIIAKSINFDSIGKMQKCSRFSGCKSEPMWKVSDKQKIDIAFYFFFIVSEI